MSSFFQPSSEILSRYAQVLVNFALNGGRGVKPGEVVFLQVPESAKPLLLHLQRAVLQAAANPIIQYLPDGVDRDFYANASDEQLKFFPYHFLKGKVKQADHFLAILAETDLHELEGVDPKKIMDHHHSFKPYMDWRNQKEAKNKFTWTLGLYATPAMSEEAGLSLEECWQQIIKACYLDDPDPVATWKNSFTEMARIKKELNSLEISRLHLISQDTDLYLGLDENRTWLGGDGRNIPSFEIFISPDWRRTEGTIYFDMPLYHFGTVIKDIRLEFHHGKVIKSSAKQNENVLKSMIAVPNADKVGEFSLTDKRLSRIDHFMAETLYDENFGGDYGNTHLALGMAFKESHPGKISKITEDEWQKMGFNDSSIHTDIIATKNRQVYAELRDGSEILIYKDGRFQI